MAETETINEHGTVWVPRRQSAEWKARAEQGESITLTGAQLLALLHTMDATETRFAEQRRQLTHADVHRSAKVRRIMRRRYRVGMKLQIERLRSVHLAACLQQAITVVPPDDPRLHIWLAALRSVEEPSSARNADSVQANEGRS